MRFTAHIWLGFFPGLFFAAFAWAGPYVPAGDVGLRSDIQLLADHGEIKGPVSTWPMAWAQILTDLQDSEVSELSPGLSEARSRVIARAQSATRSDKLQFTAYAGAAENPTRIRSFQNTPRGKAELGAGASWMGDWFAADLNVQGVDSDSDSEEFRVDNSFIGGVVGNWSIAASTQQRWWGPGWDGSLILSNNARPFPSLVFDRLVPREFKSKWLSWIGPWDLTAMFGQLEKERHIPNTQFFGMRVAFRPVYSLEIGLSRSAQWCGDGRPCDGDTFLDLLFGRDNRGDAGIDPENEPGNQLAGFDIRWSPKFMGRHLAAYGQLIGEDEAGGFPSRYLGQFGAEWSGYLFERWSTRAFAEFSGTSCQFHESSEIFNCAYNHTIYRTGYRYRSRSLGHPADNDARIISVGFVAVDADDTQWRALLRFGELNRGGSPDANNSLTATRQDTRSLDFSYRRVFSLGLIDAGVGYETIDDQATAASFSESRFYVQWQSSY